jgi:hypothetical protein
VGAFPFPAGGSQDEAKSQDQHTAFFCSSVLVVSLLLQLQSDALEVPGLGLYCLRHTYPESLLLWQHQSNLRCLQLKDSVNLGGFMTDDALLAQLPQKLPQLQCIQLDRCRNLGLLPLAKLVGSRAAGRVLVRSWKHVSSFQGVGEQTCLALELSSGGAVQVEYCW